MHYRILARCAIVLLLLSVLVPTAHLSVAQAEEDAVIDDEIIYIDNSGRIIVIDPNVDVAGNAREITWQSPDTGWFDIAAGDFNADGDAEIVAIGNGKVTIFDPVVQPGSGVTPDGEQNNVPWARLYELGLPGPPSIVGAGNLDQFVSGDEILFAYSFNEGNGIVARMTVLKRTDTQGRAWTTHATAGFGAAWQSAAVGNINNAGSADIIRLRDVTTAAAQAVQVDNNWAVIFERNKDSFTFTSAAIGQFYPGGTGEVALTRTYPGTTEAASLLVYQFTNNAWVTTNGEFKQFPHPRFVFFADINGNGDDELFWIRDVPSNASSPRMVMVNAGGDTLPNFQVGLDADNGYRVGVGGDVDADGKDEVIVMRTSRIFQYNDPENGPTSNTRFWDRSTNGRSLILANVDGNGYTAANQFNVNVSTINVSLDAGTFSEAVQTISLTVTGTNTNVQFTIAEEKNSPWFSVNTSSNTTPANLYIGQFNATQLKPGVYTDRIVIQAVGTDVSNDPFYIPVTLTVTEVDFSVSRDQLFFAFPVENPTPQQESVAVSSPFGALTYSTALMPRPAFDTAVEALGEVPDFGYRTDEGDVVLMNSLGEEYRIEAPTDAEISAAAIVWPSVPWATVQSAGNVMPDTIVVTATAAQMTQQREDAILLVIADERAGVYPNNIEVVEVTALRDQYFLYLPQTVR